MSVGPLGMNGGMDINSMVQKIVSSERVPKQQRIDSERADVNASISGYGRLKESLDSMKNLMSDFRFNKVFAARKVDVTDDSAVIAKASTNAIAGKYSVDVLQLAQSHKLASAPFDERQKFGPGKLHISMGNRSFDVNVSSYSKLNDVVRGINGAKSNPGVRAAVIKDSNGPRLVIAANQTGKDNALSVAVDAKPGDELNQLGFKTLENRVKDLEAARAEAQDILQPLTPKQKENAAKVAEKIENAAREVDKENSHQPDAFQASGQATQSYVKPQDRIPGWTETASGTLLDSYDEPQPELDSAAQEKSSQVDGWSNTASGTLYDSYVTPEEAEKKLAALRADEESSIAQAVQSGNMTPEEAKAEIREGMSPEEKQHADKIEQAQKNLQAAQKEFDNYSGLTQVQTAQDSKVILDGVATLTSNNNVIEDAIEGVDLTLKSKTDPNARPPEIDVEYDRETVSQYLEKFVNAYNQFHQVNKDLGSVDPQTGKAGPLAGESITRSAESRLKSVFSTPIKDAPQEMNSLSSLGITTTRQGGLELNHDVLNRQLVNNFDKLKDFFGGRDGFADRIQDAIQSVTGVTGAIRTREKSLTEENRRLQDDQATLDRRMDQLKTRTHAKFESMQDATSKMQSQLSGMMNALG